MMALSWSSEEHPERGAIIHEELLKGDLLVPTRHFPAGSGPEKDLNVPFVSIPGDKRTYAIAFTDIASGEKWNPDWKEFNPVSVRAIALTALNGGHEEIWINPPGPQDPRNPVAIPRKLMKLLAEGKPYPSSGNLPPTPHQPKTPSVMNSELRSTLQRLVDGNLALEEKFIAAFLTSELLVPIIEFDDGRYEIVPISTKPPLEGMGLPIFTHEEAVLDFERLAKPARWVGKVAKMPGKNILEEALKNKMAAAVLNAATPPYYEFNAKTILNILGVDKNMPNPVNELQPTTLPSDPKQLDGILKQIAQLPFFVVLDSEGKYEVVRMPGVPASNLAFVSRDIHKKSKFRDCKTDRTDARNIGIRSLMLGRGLLVILDEVRSYQLDRYSLDELVKLTPRPRWYERPLFWDRDLGKSALSTIFFVAIIPAVFMVSKNLLDYNKKREQDRLATERQMTSGWKATRGVIVDQKGYRPMSRWGSGTHYTIEYEYQVNGKVYKSNRVRLNSTEADYMHRPGRNVVVYYNPDNPNLAVLNR